MQELSEEMQNKFWLNTIWIKLDKRRYDILSEENVAQSQQIPSTK